MLHEVTNIRSDISWQKVTSWTKAVVASLRKLKVDYSSFPDVVTPFSTGLTLVRIAISFHVSGLFYTCLFRF